MCGCSSCVLLDEQGSAGPDVVFCKVDPSKSHHDLTALTSVMTDFPFSSYDKANCMRVFPVAGSLGQR